MNKDEATLSIIIELRLIIEQQREMLDKRAIEIAELNNKLLVENKNE